MTQATALPPPPASAPYYPNQPINQQGQPTSAIPPPPPAAVPPPPGQFYGPGNAGANTPATNPNVGGGGTAVIGGGSGGGGGWAEGGGYGPGYQGAPNDNPAGAATNPSAVDVRTGAPGYGDFQRYEDAAHEQAMRRLEPQMTAADETFRQQMLNRGITEGSEAWARAKGDFDRARNDAYSQAAFGAMQEGRAAQEQAFQQGLAESTLANALRRAQIGADAQRFSARQGANASRYAASLANQLGFANLGEQGRQFDLGLGQRESEFGRNWGLNALQGIGNLALGFQGQGLQGQQMQEAFRQGHYGRAMGALGPGMIGPHGPSFIDPNAATNAATNAGAAQAQAARGWLGK